MRSTLLDENVSLLCQSLASGGEEGFGWNDNPVATTKTPWKPLEQEEDPGIRMVVWMALALALVGNSPLVSLCTHLQYEYTCPVCELEFSGRKGYREHHFRPFPRCCHLHTPPT